MSINEFDDLFLEVNNTIENKKKLKLYKNLNTISTVTSGLSTIGLVSSIASDNIILASIASGVILGSVVTNYVSRKKVNDILYKDDVSKEKIIKK